MTDGHHHHSNTTGWFTALLIALVVIASAAAFGANRKADDIQKANADLDHGRVSAINSRDSIITAITHQSDSLAAALAACRTPHHRPASHVRHGARCEVAGRWGRPFPEQCPRVSVGGYANDGSTRYDTNRVGVRYELDEVDRSEARHSRDDDYDRPGFWDRHPRIHSFAVPVLCLGVGALFGAAIGAGDVVQTTIVSVAGGGGHGHGKHGSHVDRACKAPAPPTHQHHQPKPQKCGTRSVHAHAR